MKAKQLKRIISFINQYHPNHTSKSLSALLKSNPEQFISLLNKTVEQADSVPNSVVNFMTEVGKQVQQETLAESPKQEQPTKENPTMNNQKKTPIIMRLITVVKGAWAKAVQLLTSNKGKVKLVMSAIAVATVAIVTSKGTAILTLIAALKSRGLINSVTGLFTKALNLLKIIKGVVVGKLSVAMNIIQMGGLVALDKVIALKNFVVLKVKQAWSWVVELFTLDADNKAYLQAA